MKNLIKSRRGIAIEMAIGAMFIMIALSIVLISISGMQTQHMTSDKNDFDEKKLQYEITDKILSGNINDDKIKVDGIDYSVEITEYTEENTFKKYTVKDSDENIVLTVTTAVVNENEIITSWGK